MAKVSPIFLLDTNVLSEPGRQRPNPNVIEFLSDQQNHFRIPVNAIAEMRMGSNLLRRTNPLRSLRLEAYQASLITARTPVQPVCLNSALAYADLISITYLKRFWYKDTGYRRPNPGQDLWIAAIASANQYVVATMDSDFQLIQDHYPNFSIYDPKEQTWHEPGPRIQSAALT